MKKGPTSACVTPTPKATEASALAGIIAGAEAATKHDVKLSSPVLQRR